MATLATVAVVAVEAFEIPALADTADLPVAAFSATTAAVAVVAVAVHAGAIIERRLKEMAVTFGDRSSPDHQPDLDHGARGSDFAPISRPHISE